MVPKFLICIIYVLNSLFVSEMNTKSIFAVMNTNWAVVETRPEKNQASTGFEPTISGIPVQYSTNEANYFGSL